MSMQKEYILLIALITVMATEATEAANLSPAPVASATPLTGQEAHADPDRNRKPSLAWGNELYTHYCTPCHGIQGDGNGFNAPRLLVKPANHTDAKFMSERDDLKLFDTINLGGVEVAKSTLMPPWGAALGNDNKIKSLILKLRSLCDCQSTKKW